MINKFFSLVIVMGFVLLVCAPIIGIFGLFIGSFIIIGLLAYLFEE